MPTYHQVVFKFAAVAAGLILTLTASAADNVAPEGFQALFNGIDLTGWKEKNEQKTGHWSATDGMLAYDGKGGELHTVEQFSNFVLLIDFLVKKGGNSGVYLRGNTQVEINDGDSPAKPIWNGTTGGIYPDLAPLKRAAEPAGEWNHLEVRVEKRIITVLLNGVKTVDSYAKNWGKKTAGTVGFQHHGHPIWFKNVYLKRLED